MRDFSSYKNRSSLCSSTFSILELKKPTCDANHKEIPHFKVTANCCKTKLCPKCTKIFLQKIRNNFKQTFLSEKLRMFTISIKPSGNVSNDLHSIEHSFTLLLKRLKHTHNYLRYFKVIEVGKQNGMVHIHGIWNIYIDWVELQKIWIEVSGSRNVYLEKVRSFEGSINYLLKYIQKSFANPDTVKYFYESYKRQYSYSSHNVIEKRKNTIWKFYDNYTRTKTEMIAFIKSMISIFTYRPNDFACTEIENFHEEIAAEIFSENFSPQLEKISPTFFSFNVSNSEIKDTWLS